jgi:hypothetical protein
MSWIKRCVPLISTSEQVYLCVCSQKDKSTDSILNYLSKCQPNLQGFFCCCCCFVILGLELTPPALFCDGFLFWGKGLQTIYLGWLWNAILLITASWVVRIALVSHWHLANLLCNTSFFLKIMRRIDSSLYCEIREHIVYVYIYNLLYIS